MLTFVQILDSKELMEWNTSTRLYDESYRRVFSNQLPVGEANVEDISVLSYGVKRFKTFVGALSGVTSSIVMLPVYAIDDSHRKLIRTPCSCLARTSAQSQHKRVEKLKSGETINYSGQETPTPAHVGKHCDRTPTQQRRLGS